jgi:hypothetical protein
MTTIDTRYTVQAGRGICRDGALWVSLHRPEQGGASPTEADALTQYLTAILNSDVNAFARFYRAYMGR